ncbi:SNF2 family N-terminal domain-containing protein [Immersiella caudata]|uniref:SNF2 family N-terminal domain-containing protein n=1 Tax=Immersiella caudata TaxID=314043 RepID=A0AA39WR60_9PEZI|nr:SNF2 family N-terminal domain-containing protein [Immersiella caudata]
MDAGSQESARDQASSSVPATPNMSWQAATLLNPRGAGTPPSSSSAPQPLPMTSSQLTNGSQPSDAVSFQFANRAGTYIDLSGMLYERTRSVGLPYHPHASSPNLASSGNPYTNGLPNGVLGNGATANQTPVSALQNGLVMSNGFGKHIERLNNVEERPAVPVPKRRKTQTESDPPQASPVYGESSGVLGEHIKRQPALEAGRHKPASKPAETVDLTDNDNDVQEVAVVPREPTNEEEVCFGMVDGARINCHTIPHPKPGAFALGGPSFWPQVKVVLKRITTPDSCEISVYDHTRRIFGTIDSKTARCLAPILDKGQLRIRTDCRIPTRRKEPGEDKSGQPISRALKAELMLYGPRKLVNVIGSHFQRCSMTLLTPTRVDAGVKVAVPTTTRATPVPAMTPIAPTPNSAVARTVEEIRSEVLGVFDSLPHTDTLPEMEPSPVITTALLKHQRQALYFMTSREREAVFDTKDKIARSTWCLRKDKWGGNVYYNLVTNQTQRERPPEALGGILADMMGLGKTLSVLSLIASTLDQALEWEKLSPVQPKVPEKKPTNSFNPPKPQSLELTPVVLNGRTTLLICPLSTVTNWEEQLRQHVAPGSISYHIYHGPNREKDPRKLAQYDLVITTYGSVSSELNSRNKKKRGLYPLEEIAWFRIVLDEAHMIREQNTLAFKSICRLQASRRWAVTGTPVQNKLEDLASLLAFLRLKPFDERSKFVQYIITPFKNADPEIVPKLRVLIDTITIRRLKDKINLPKRTDEIVRLDFTENERTIYDWFNRNTVERVRVLTGQGSQERIAGKAMIHILRSILQLRLICAHGKDLLNDADLEELKGMTADTPIDLSDDEEDKPVLQEGKAYEFYYLLQESNGDICAKCQVKLGSNEVIDLEGDNKDDVIGYMSSAPCVHIYCPDCLNTLHRQPNNQRCDECCERVRESFCPISRSRAMHEHESRQAKKNQGAVLKNVNSREDEEYIPHTKTRALVEELRQHKMMSLENPHERPYKSVVFSGWTSHLDLIEKALNQEGIIFTRLDGKMTRVARNLAMEEFRDNPDVQVILVSIMAGGLGLNLTTANTVYVMEPQFNPAAEAQAIDRVHRLGQTREVRTVRFVMNKSFEESMLDLQDKKTKLANLSMDDRDKAKIMNRNDAAKQRLIDLRSLFK